MNSPDNADSSRQEESTRRKTFWKAILYFFLLVATVFAAWQAYVFYRTGRGGSYQPQAVSPSSLRPDAFFDNGSDWLPANPSEIIGKWSFEMEGDPADVAPPPGAKKLFAGRRTVKGYLYQHASYHYPGSAEAAREHYRRLAGEKGFLSHPDQGAKSTRKNDIFLRNDQRGTVLMILRLRNHPTAEKIIRIELMAAQPAEN